MFSYVLCKPEAIFLVFHLKENPRIPLSCHFHTSFLSFSSSRIPLFLTLTSLLNLIVHINSFVSNLRPIGVDTLDCMEWVSCGLHMRLSMLGNIEHLHNLLEAHKWGGGGWEGQPGILSLR